MPASKEKRAACAQTVGEDGFALLDLLQGPEAPPQFDQLPCIAALWQSFTVKSLGDEEVNGVVAEHLEIEVDLKELWDQLIHELNDQLGGTLSLPPEETDEAWKVISQGLEIKESDVWIDHEGYLRKAVLALAFGLPDSLDKSVIEFEMEINLFDYGEDIIIELPAEYEDVSSLFGAQIY